MRELDSDVFGLLYLAKTLYDSPRFKNFSHMLDAFPLDGDFVYEMAMEAATSIFQNTDVYYNEDEDVETWIFTDPVIDRFCELCGRLETQNNLEAVYNPYRRQVEQLIRDALTLDYSCDFDWELPSGTEGRRRILFYESSEFCSLYELPEALLGILEGFQSLNRQLEAELGLNKIIPIYPYMSNWKEAA